MKIIIAISILMSLNCLAASLDDHNAVLRASQLVRNNHAATDSMSIKEYGTVGSVKLDKFVKNENEITLNMTYMGPADMCSYLLVVKDDVAKIQSNDCAE